MLTLLYQEGMVRIKLFLHKSHCVTSHSILTIVVVSLAHKSGVVWIGDRLVKVGNTDLSKGTIFDVPGIIAKKKRPTIMVFDAEHDNDLERMDNLSVASGIINKLLEGSKEVISDDSQYKEEGSTKTVIPPSPSKKLCESVQAHAAKR